MMGLGTPELILIVVVFLIFFGAKKIPEMAQGLGKGIKEFRKGIKDVQTDIENDSATTSTDTERERNLDKRELELIKREQELRKKLEDLRLDQQTGDGKVILLEASENIPYQDYFEIMAMVTTAGGAVAIVRDKEAR